MSVVSVDIHNKRTYSAGESFGDVGTYDRIEGVIEFAVDPEHDINNKIVDLHLAPRDTDSKVHFKSDFILLTPTNASSSNGRLIVDVVNRGRPRVVNTFNMVAGDPQIDDPVGDGFLMRHGYSIVSIGWQWDVPVDPTLLQLEAPFATDNGLPIRGQTIVEIRPSISLNTALLANRLHTVYRAVDVNQSDARLLVRDWEDGPDEEIERSRWSFACDVDGDVELSNEHVYMQDGFVPGKIYQVVYETEDTPVVGAGLLSLREIASFLRVSSDLNPTSGFEYVYGYGVSQTGRILRHLLYLGLNVDESGNKAFDGLLPHVAGARRGEFNHRFGQPSQQSLPGFGHLFPFADLATVDPYSEQSEGLLDYIIDIEALPKVMYTNSGAEYWRSDGSMLHIDPSGSKDLSTSEEVRIYYYAGTQHVAGTMPPNTATGGDGARPRYGTNVVDYRPLLRAALVNLDKWVTNNVEPPESKYPKLEDNTAMFRDEVLDALPDIPDLDLPDPDRLWVLRVTDLGPDASEGIGRYPVIESERYPTFVSAVDEDGNETSGIRLPDLTVPVATHFPWNLRNPDSGAPEQIVPMIGSSHFFAFSEDERLSNDDPRPSIQSRYSSREEYLRQVEDAVTILIRDRYLLEEDLYVVLDQAAERYDFVANR